METHRQIAAPRPPLLVRPARPEDAEACLAVYAPYVRETAITFEYEVPTLAEFQGRMARIRARYPFLAAEREGRLVGYAHAGPFVGRAAYDWAVETGVYVARESRRSGVGGRLYQVLEQCLAAMGVLNMNACIAYPASEDKYLTLDSVLFHHRLGFRWVGEFRACGCKFERWYNMVWMEKHIGPHVAPPPPLRPFARVQDEIRDRGLFDLA